MPITSMKSWLVNWDWENSKTQRILKLDQQLYASSDDGTKLPPIELNRVGQVKSIGPNSDPIRRVQFGLYWALNRVLGPNLNLRRPKSTYLLKLAQSKCVCFRLINLIKIRKCELPIDLITTNTQIRNINIYLFIKKIVEVNKFKKKMKIKHVAVVWTPIKIVYIWPFFKIYNWSWV